MSLGHLHLILNHIPILGIPMGLLLFLYSKKTRNEGMQSFSFFFIVGIGLAVVATFLTGEPAEELVEKLPGVTKDLIHAHEEAGEVAMVLTLVAAATAFLSLFATRVAKLAPVKRFLAPLLVLSLLGAMGSLAYTGNLGGDIRHSELRADAVDAAPGATATEIHDDD